jgi:hypothetical protein
MVLRTLALIVEEGKGGVVAAEVEQSLKLEAYRTALQARNLEINLFWQRSNYFLVLNTAIAVGFVSLDKRDVYAFLLSLIGVVVACLWVRVNLGSKFWQSRWEHRLHVVEEELQGNLNLFSADWTTIQDDVRQSLGFGGPGQGWITQLYNRAVMRKPSVSKSMTLLSVFFVSVWAATAVLAALSAFR